VLLSALVFARGRPNVDSSPGAAAPVGDAVPGALAGSGSSSRGEAASDAPPERPGDPVGVARPREIWRGRVASVLRRAALQRLGRPLMPAAETRLVDALATVAPAARGLDRDTLDPDDPASIAAVRERTAALLEADRVCRDELGIGIAELLRTLDRGHIEDGAPTPAPRG